MALAQVLYRSAPPSQHARIWARLPAEQRTGLPAPKIVDFQMGYDTPPTSSQRRAARLEGKRTVTVMRTYKMRLYPTPAQAARLQTWCEASRAVYNAAAERNRVEGHPGIAFWHKGDRAATGAGPSGKGRILYNRLFNADGSMKKAAERAQDETLAWLNDAPADALWYALRDLEFAWQAYDRRCKERKRSFLTDRRGHRKDDRPGFRARDRGESFRLAVWKVAAGGEKKHCCVLFNHRGVRLPKLGWVGMVKHARIVSQTKEATILREHGHWFIAINAEVTVLERQAPDVTVGVDLGVVHPVMTSDGDTLAVTRPRDDLVQSALRAQRRMSRRKKRSRGWRRWQQTLARRKRQAALEKRRQLHKAARTLADTARVVKMENLDLRNMTASAKGTADTPGRNVAAKAGLNRALLEIPKFGFRLLVQYKVEARGGRLELVPPAHTSQRCNACGHIDRANRIEQAVFHCQRCGHRDHADVNAAQNIRDLPAGVAIRREAEPDLLTGLERAGGTRRPAQKPHEATKRAGRGYSLSQLKGDRPSD